MHEPIYANRADLSAVLNQAPDALYADARNNVFTGQPGRATLAFNARPLSSDVQVVAPPGAPSLAVRPPIAACRATFRG